MKFSITSLLLMALLTACSPRLSDEKIISYTAPALPVYDKETQAKAAKELQQYCPNIPIVCNVLLPDYAVMRDQVRILKGEEVDAKR